jgi:hypothetical protein
MNTRRTKRLYFKINNCENHNESNKSEENELLSTNSRTEKKLYEKCEIVTKVNKMRLKFI